MLKTIIIASVDNRFTVKRLSYVNKKPYLMPENPDFEPISISEESDVEIFGVVTKIIRTV